MKVKELIKALKKMPQNLEVGVAAHDNSEFEVAGWVCQAIHERKKDFDPKIDGSADVHIIKSQPAQWVVLRC